jgi:hypothetical protein
MPRRRGRRRDEEREHRVLPAAQEQEATVQPAGKAQALMELQRTRGNRYVQRVLAGSGGVQRSRFGDEDGAALKPAYIQNPAAREDVEKECREVMPTGLQALFRAKSGVEQGTEPPSDLSLKDTIAKYVKYRLLNLPAEFEFADERGRMTKGENKPEALTDKVEDALIKRVKGVKGWHLFGLSLMDAERSVLLAVDNRNPSALRIYWMDRIEGGFKDVTGRVDERITQFTKEMWTAQPPDRRRRTRVIFWPFAPA